MIAYPIYVSVFQSRQAHVLVSNNLAANQPADNLPQSSELDH